LTEADVVAIIPVVSPRRLWGHVLVRTDLLGASFSDEDDQALDAVADQLALLLDGAELLARTRAVERSLAHAEQLAAIGELAARIAHEIRNPITAARSLAQQLVQEESAFGEEHRLILAELERVEKQVAALLRVAPCDGQRPRRAGRRAPASVRALLLAQGGRDGARARDREVYGRRAWRQDRAREPGGRRYDRPHRAAARTPAGGAAPAMKGRVLVVDDERAIGIAIQRLLAGRGHHVDTALSAEDAFGRLAESAYHIVITDLS